MLVMREMKWRMIRWRMMILRRMMTMMLRMMMLRRRTDPKTQGAEQQSEKTSLTMAGTHTLCEPAQAKCTWACCRNNFFAEKYR